MLNGLVDHLLNAPAVLVYVLVAALVFAEDALFVGFVIPGETAAVLGGVDASRGQVHVSLVLGAVVLAAIAGDSVGYEVGRHLGTRLLEIRPLRRHRERLVDAQRLLARRGGVAVFVGRFVAFFRAVMPALAGTARMTYRRFLAFNALGGVVWSLCFVLLGFLAGNSYRTLERTIGRGVAIGVAGLVVAALVVWRIQRHRHAAQPERDAPAGDRRDDVIDEGAADTPA